MQVIKQWQNFSNELSIEIKQVNFKIYEYVRKSLRHRMMVTFVQFPVLKFSCSNEKNFSHKSRVFLNHS